VAFIDDVTCDYPIPDGREIAGRAFQTKSLWCGMDRFTISAVGRLIFHQYHYPPPPPGERRPGPAVHFADIDMNFHGDMYLQGADENGHPARYAVRFTHGVVEWVRPFDDLPALHREWLMRAGG
jgi:hypothetical protein